jgi:plastocyanin
MRIPAVLTLAALAGLLLAACANEVPDLDAGATRTPPPAAASSAAAATAAAMPTPRAASTPRTTPAAASATPTPEATPEPTPEPTAAPTPPPPAPTPVPATPTPPAATATPPPSGATYVTAIANFAFEATIAVPAGTTVVWTNQDGFGHDVTASAGAFASPIFQQGESWPHRFDQPGSYPYICTIHPFMKGTVVVQ